MDLPQVGRLTYKEPLLEIEYPIVFVCSASNGSYYLFYECESTDDYERWIVCPLSDVDSFMLRTNQMSLRKFFRLYEAKSMTVIHNFDSDSYEIMRQMTISEEDLPDERLFIGHSGADDDFAHALYEDKRYAGKPCLTFRLNPYSNTNGINLKDNINILNGAAQYIEAMGGKRQDYITVNSYGSVVISIMPAKKEDEAKAELHHALFGGFQNLLSSKNLDEMLEASQNNPIAVNKMKKAIECLNDIGNGAEVYTKEANGQVKTSLVNPNDVKTIYKEFKECAISQPTEKEVSGTLVGYNVKRKNFTFVAAEGGDIFEGKLDESFAEDKQYPVPSKVVAKLVLFERKTGKSSKVFYRLKSVEVIE